MGRHFRRALIAILMMGIFAGACVVRTGDRGRHRHGVTHKHKKQKHKKHKKHAKHRKHKDRD